MIYFLIFTLLFWAAHSGGLFYFMNMIQEGGALDTLFNYQNLLRRLYASDKPWKNYLGKAIGDCRICTSFWSAPIVFIGYAVLLNSMDIWVIHGFWANVVWFWVFWVTSGTIAFQFISKTMDDGL